MKLLNRILAVALATAMISMTTLSVSAETQQSTITADVTGGFTVSIPKTIELSIDSSKTGLAEYATYAKGDTEGGTSIFINPEVTFNLVEQVTGESFHVTILQDKIEWNLSDLKNTEPVSEKGYLISEELAPGNYRGTFYFNVEKTESSPALVPGLYNDAGHTDLIMDWDTFVSYNGVKVTNGNTIEYASYEIYGYLVLPDTITTIKPEAFYGCDLLEGIWMSDNVTSLGVATFYSCESLTDVRLSNGLSELPEYCFGCTYSLREITLPKSINSIGSNCFDHAGLERIILHEDVSDLGTSIFCKNERIRYIIVDSNNTNFKAVDNNLYSIDGSTLMEYARGKSEKVFTVPAGVTSIADGAACDADRIEKLILPEGLLYLGSQCFADSKRLEDVTIPASVITIPANPFPDCDSLSEIKIDSNNANFCVIDGVLYSKDMTRLICYPKGKIDLSEFIVPDGVVTIDKGAFSQNESLTKVTLPESVTTIETAAFNECVNLTTINLSQSNVTSIGDGAFYDCESLYITALPSGLTSMGEEAFCGCSKIPGLVIPGSLETVPYGAFAECTSFNYLSVGSGVKVIDDYAFSDCTGFTYSFVLPDTVETIGTGAFYNCPINYIQVPSSVTKIGRNAFYNVDKVIYNGTASGNPWGANSVVTN